MDLVLYWTKETIGESILELHETNATQLNSAGQISVTIKNQDQFLHLHNSYLLIVVIC